MLHGPYPRALTQKLKTRPGEKKNKVMENTERDLFLEQQSRPERLGWSVM